MVRLFFYPALFTGNTLTNFMHSQYVEDDFTQFLNTYLHMEVTQDNSWCAYSSKLLC